MTIVMLPLWSPSTVEIGSVGYLLKPEGEFVTLFNAFDPPTTSGGALKGMANLYGYGQISQGSHRQDKRNRAQRGLDVLQSWLPSKSDPFVNSLNKVRRILTVACRNNINRRYSFSLKANHKIAFLCVESTMYNYIEDLSTPKKWFKANIDEILRSYGDDHSITKEDAFLGTRIRLRTRLKYLLLPLQSSERLVHRITLCSSVTNTPMGRYVRIRGSV